MDVVLHHADGVNFKALPLCYMVPRINDNPLWGRTFQKPGAGGGVIQQAVILKVVVHFRYLTGLAVQLFYLLVCIASVGGEILL